MNTATDLLFDQRVRVAWFERSAAPDPAYAGRVRPSGVRRAKADPPKKEITS
jgi:hypothetical protein